MTEKELHRLRRQDLLQLLLTQSKEVAQLSEEVEGKIAENQALRETIEKLNTKLDEKDEQIKVLINYLNPQSEIPGEEQIPLSEQTAL